MTKTLIRGGDGDNFGYSDAGIEQAEYYANHGKDYGGMVLRAVNFGGGEDRPAGPGLAIRFNSVHFAGFTALTRENPEIHPSTS